MNLLKKILSPSPAKTSRVRITEASRVKLPSGDIADASAGDEIELLERDANDLVLSERAVLVSADEARTARAKRIAELIPQAETPRPAPESFKDLPECFSAWFSRNERGMILQKRRAAITEKLIATATRYTVRPGIRAIGSEIPNAITAGKFVQGWISGSLQTAPPEHHAELAALRDAEVRAQQAVDDWMKANGEALTRDRLKCSFYTQEQHGTLCREIGELHSLAFSLFSARVGALGLAESKARELFQGSRDALEFAAIPKPALHDLRLAYHDEGTDPVLYIDITPPEMAALISGWNVTRAEVARLMKAVQKELTAAKKVAA